MLGTYKDFPGFDSFTSQDKGNEEFCKYPPGLYLVGTPLGNREDITIRALRLLSVADLIACEDTRHSGLLLKHYGISARLTSYHDHNAARQRPKLLKKLAEGKRIALISDAGTPLIADPGYKLVQMALQQGIYVTALPGPCAGVLGLLVSGLGTDQFYFAGFPPDSGLARRKFYQKFKTIPATLIFYESPHRLLKSLEDLNAALGPRLIAVARELTKKFEDIVRGKIPDILKMLEANYPLKGEIVLVVEGALQKKENALTEDELSDLIAQYRLTSSVKETVSEITALSGYPRKKIYDLVLKFERKNLLRSNC